MAKRSTDGVILPSITDSTADCFVGIKFPLGYVGAMNEISFFLDEFYSGHIVNKLVIQASSDNFVESIETLIEVSEEAHEGWNYYDLTEVDQPRFQYYRLKSNATSSGCDGIGEIHYFGYEVIDDENDSYTCDVKLVQTSTNLDGEIVVSE